MLEEVPIGFMAYDLLEFDGNDVRQQTLLQRWEILSRLLSNLAGDRLIISPIVTAKSWQDLAILREDSRRRGVEGFMVKRLDSTYAVGRRRGNWWKCKIDPLTADAVLIYAQMGHGKRAGLYTDYTFAVWQGDTLVSFAKAYSGLNDEEIRQVDRFIRRNTLERFGPVRSVRPELVFEIAFEGIQRSSRHKCGLAVRFPRIVRWRRDKKIEEADTIETLNTLLSAP